MDFRQLEAYIKTVELRSFSKAGEVMYLSQPSISNYIMNLEKELGVALIVRTTKDVKPTKTGKLFYEYAKNIIALKDKAVFSVKMRSNSASGEIEIHASSVPAQYILPETIVSFYNEYPGISFKIIQSDTEKVVQDILSQNCEIGVVGAKIESSKLNYEFIVSESLVLIGAADKRLVADASFIYNENFISREGGSATKQHTDSFLKSININPEKLNKVACFTNTQSIIHAVAKGLGISVVSEIAAQEYINNNLIEAVKLAPSREFYFVYKKNTILAPQVKLFIRHVCNYFASQN